MIKKIANKYIKQTVKYVNDRKAWKTNRKIVVIESDDWGSIRMPSRKVYNDLIKRGYNCNTDSYLKYDSLASHDDLEALFNTLISVKGAGNRNAVITANTVVANPNFEKIRKDSFNVYHYELFTETLKKYSDHEKSFDLWKEGIKSDIFKPQFHGREHINIYNWIKDLNSNNILREAFDNNMISISSEKCKLKSCYMESLDYYSIEEKNSKTSILDEGLNIFEKIFNQKSESFIANCYVWYDDVEKILSEKGVKYIQGIPLQYIPSTKNDRHFYKRKLHYTGEKNQFNQLYLVRNVHFEPSLYKSRDIVLSQCLKRIEYYFKINRPVIISSHRLNFIGFIDENNRNENLKLFKILLKSIIKKWPEVEFMTSNELGNLISNS